MLFNSVKYFLFLPVVYLVVYCAGERARWFLLLAASLFFYAAVNVPSLQFYAAENVPYLLFILILVASITYGCGIWLDRTGTLKAKRALLWGGIGANVLILIAMKYLPFLSTTLNDLSALFSLGLQIQPVKAFISIGVSFYVFQAISYLLDIYFDQLKPELHFGYFLLYLAFFPKILQGPIERASDLLPQLRVKYEFNYDNMRFGLILFAWGLLKKVVLADRFGFYVDAVYNNVFAFTGLPLLLSTYAYAFQIYLDFSGYTDMALGSALLFNIKLTQNFNSPFIAASIADFWRRWHISFSLWILDYIFTPLQMKWRSWGKWGTAAALIATFLVVGIWHGAAWGFLIFGLFQGLCMACSVFYRPYQKKIYKALGIEKTRALKIWQIFVTFHLVCFSLIFFRAHDIQQAAYIICNMFNGSQEFCPSFLLTFGLMERINLLALLTYAAIVLLYHYAQFNNKLMSIWTRHYYVRWLCYNFLIFFIILFRVQEKSGFMYFQF
jgi:alginate O-acetyltransferase complex protein AlgI